MQVTRSIPPPVADLNMDGVVNSTDSTLWSDLLYSTSNASVYADSDLDFDGLDDWNSGGADGDLFYESYNENLGLSGVGRVSSPAVASRTGYAGYQWDQTLAAYHVRYRVYLPDIGRWTRRDPLGYVDGMGLYQYVQAKVMGAADPLGLEPPDVRTPEDARRDVCAALQDALDRGLTPEEFLKEYATTFGINDGVFYQTKVGPPAAIVDIDWLLTLLYVYYHGVPLGEPENPWGVALRGVPPEVLYLFGKSGWILIDTARSDDRYLRDFFKRFGQSDEWWAVAIATDVIGGRTDLLSWLGQQFDCELRVSYPLLRPADSTETGCTPDSGSRLRAPSPFRMPL